MPGFEPQTAVKLAVINVDAATESTPTITEATLLTCPDGANMQMELLSVSYRANTLTVDAGGVTVDIEFIDDSDTDSVTNLKAAYDCAAATVLVSNAVWRGSQIMDPGDAINAEFATDGGITTPSEGAAFIVEYRVLRHS